MSIFDKFNKIAGRVTDRVQERVGGLVEDTFLPERVRTALMRAEIAINQSRWDDALAELDRIEGDRQAHVRVRLLRGIAYMELGRDARAIHFLEKAVRERETAETAYFLGLAYERAGRLGDARNALLAGVRLERDAAQSFDLLFSLGRVHLAMGRPQRAERELRAALQQRPGDLGSVALLAASLKHLGEVDAAAELLASHTSSFTSDEPWVLLGQLRAEQGRVVEAREAFDRVLQRHEHQAALDGAAACAVAERDWDGALALVARADALSPPTAARVTLRARIAEASGDLAAADDAYTQALQAEPGRVEALLGAGRVALHHPAPDGDPPRVLELNERALRTLETSDGPVSVEDLRAAQIGIARAHLRLGDRAAAMRTLEASQAHFASERDGLELQVARAELALASGSMLEALALAEDLVARGASLPPTLEPHGLRASLGTDLELAAALQPDAPVHQVAAALERLRDHMADVPALVTHIAEVTDVLENLGRPLSVAVLGEFNAGKSTLVNAWLGEPVLATGVLPTTAHVNVIRYGPRRVGRLVLRDEGGETTVLEMPWHELREAVEGRDEGTIARIEYDYPHHELRAVNFIDTPGFNAAVDGHDAIAQGALSSADAVLWLIDVNQVLTGSQREVLTAIEGAEEKVVVLLNKVDALDADEEAELVAYLRSNVGDAVKTVLPVSALRAFELRDTARREGGEPDASALDAARWTGFRTVLQASLLDRTGRLKVLEATRRIRALAAEILASTTKNRSRLALLATQIAEGRDALHKAEATVLRSELPTMLERLSTQRDVALRAVAREVDDALRPTGGWLSPMQLETEDLGYLMRDLQRRLGRALGVLETQVLAEVGAPVDAALQALEWVARALDPHQAQTFFRRIEAFAVGERMTRRLLHDRVLGRFRAELDGAIGALVGHGESAAGGTAAGDALAERLGAEGATDATRRAELASTLGTSEQTLDSDLRAWIAEYFDSARRLCDNIRRDIERLRLEVELFAEAPFADVAIGDPDPDAPSDIERNSDTP